MGIHALDILPLVQRLDSICKQVWYVDNATACEDVVGENGPAYGCNTNPSKKRACCETSTPLHCLEILPGLTSHACEGKHHLHSAIGTIDAICSNQIKLHDV